MEKTYEIMEIRNGRMMVANMEDILKIINDQGQENWTPYTEEDWQEGWNEFVEGKTHKMV